MAEAGIRRTKTISLPQGQPFALAEPARNFYRHKNLNSVICWSTLKHINRIGARLGLRGRV
jgi:hypothetical protein